MRRVHLDPRLRFRVEPAVECASAGEFYCVDRVIRIDDGEFEVALEGRSNDVLPIHATPICSKPLLECL